MNAKEYYPIWAEENEPHLLNAQEASITFAESYHQHKLSEITEEEIEGMADALFDDDNMANPLLRDIWISGFTTCVNLLKNS